MLFFSLFFSDLPFAFSDMVYLKNKDNSIEGIIEKEDEFTVVFNMGYGTITLQKKDIKYIQSYTAEQQNELRERWKYRYFARSEFVPDNLKDIAREFNNLGNIRYLAIENKKEKDKTVKQIEKLENELQELNANLAASSDSLSAAKPEEDSNRYNALVNKFNFLVAKIKSVEYDKDSLQKELMILDKKVSGYVNDFLLFRKRFSQRYDDTDKKAQEQNRPFFGGVKKELDMMEKDFTKHTIDFNEYGLGIMVDAVLNNAVRANLIVDTGASVVMLSKEIADKLGLYFTHNDSAAMLVTLADGNKVKANPAILDSVKVGDVEVKNVRAAVLQNSKATQEDGLLGMSFLENFLMRIDAKSNKLILEEFKP